MIDEAIDHCDYAKPFQGKLKAWILIILVWVIYEYMLHQFAAYMISNHFIEFRTRPRTTALQEYLILVLLVPLIEESIYRLSLLVRPLNILISVLCALWFNLFMSDIYTWTLHETNLLLRLAMGGIVTATLIWLYGRTELTQVVSRRLQSFDWLSLLVISSCLFAVAHQGKLIYPMVVYGIVWMFFVYFIPGMFLGYVRVRLGFWAAVMFHCMNNAIPLFIVLYFSVKFGENFFMFI